MATKTLKTKNPPLYERKKTGRLVPCPGEAHDPRVGGMIDNCSICAPRWGEVEEKEPKLTLDQVVAACYAGLDVDVSDIALDAFLAIYNARVTFSNRTDKTGCGLVSFNVVRIAKPECGHSACRQNWIDTGETGCVEGKPL